MSPALLWHRGDRLPSASISPYRVLHDRRIAVREVAEVAALVERHNRAGRPRLFPDLSTTIVPSSWKTAPPPDVESVISEVDEALRAGRFAAAASTITDVRHALLHETAIGAEGRRLWSMPVERWDALARGTSAELEFRGLRIQVAAASGATSEAAVAIREWLASPSPPPWRWVVTQSCRIDPHELCLEVVGTAAASTHDLELSRLYDLTVERCGAMRFGQ
jgi:hypothetical protein